MKCGTKIAASPDQQTGQGGSKEATPAMPILAPTGATSLKCPNCGAPIAPKFGEMIITCEYCGSGVTLGNDGWRGIQKQTMLPIVYTEQEKVLAKIHELMDKGLLHRHLQEQSTSEELSLNMVPYWIVQVSARTSVVVTDMVSQTAQTATTAALMGVILGGMGGGGGGGRGGGGRRRVFIPRIQSLQLPSWGMTFIGGLGGAGNGPSMINMYGQRGGANQRTYDMAGNYNFPIIALKALNEYQPKSYQFRLDKRMLFDVTKVPKGVKILNGDVGEEAAKYQAKALVDQLQSEKAHAQYHMIQQLHTQIDVADAELLHVPIWFARYDHKGKKIILVIDGYSGDVINSIGL
jgi:hypothetical protein